MTGWVCSECGRGDVVVVSSARPSLDDRYAIGYCEVCAPMPEPEDPTKPKRRRLAPKSVPLVRADKWDPDSVALRRRQAEEARLVDRLMKGKLTSDADIDRARGLLAKWDRDAAARVG